MHIRFMTTRAHPYTKTPNPDAIGFGLLAYHKHVHIKIVYTQGSVVEQKVFKVPN